ncbi:MAG: TrkA family potassium uptake protein [Chloroflexi bacterium]|nr:TrkA family potassium uptake protein [Chloroflexota bacterium]
MGYYLSKSLLSEGHEVLVIDRDPARVERIEEELGSVCMQGDGCEAATLEEAGARRAGLFVAVTGEDEDNLVACQVARHRFNVPRVVARMNNPRNEALFKKLGIDVTISATNLILEHIGQEVSSRRLVHLLDISETSIEVVQIRVQAGAPAVGRQIGQLALPSGNVLALIIRNREVVLPADDTAIEADDRVIAVTSTDTEQALCSVLCGNY